MKCLAKEDAEYRHRERGGLTIWSENPNLRKEKKILATHS